MEKRRKKKRVVSNGEENASVSNGKPSFEFKLNQEATEKSMKRVQTKKKKWTPKEGKSKIRLIPFPDGSGSSYEWIFAVLKHYDVGPGANKQVTCLQNWGEDCPVCEEVIKLKDQGEEEGNPVYVRMSINMAVKDQAFLFLIDRANEEAGLQYWAIAPKWLGQIRSFTIDMEEGEIPFLHPKKGQDLSFRRDGTTRDNTEYSAWRLIKGESVSDEILEEVQEQRDFLMRKFTTEQIQAIIDGDEDMP